MPASLGACFAAFAAAAATLGADTGLAWIGQAYQERQAASTAQLAFIAGIAMMVSQYATQASPISTS